MRAAYAELRGHYAFVALTAREPGVLVGARKECPLIVGRGDGETFIASAIPAFLRDTRRVQYIGDDELVVLRPEGTEFYTAAGEPVEHEVVEIDWDADTAEKQGYETFMLKEIHEQADAVAETIGERAARGWGIDLGDRPHPPRRSTPIDDDLLTRIRRVVIVACGTAYHAGLIGRYAIEQWARVPVEVDIASEYRYRDPVVGPDDLVIGDLPVRGDRRHAGGHADRARQGRDGAGGHQRDGGPGHPRGRRGPLHPRRPGDRRGRDQDVRQPDHRHVPARAAPRGGPRGDGPRRSSSRRSPTSSGCRT